MKIKIKPLIHSNIIIIGFIVILTIWSELSKPFKNFLADITGHHWVTKGVFSIILFAVLYFVLTGLYKKDSLDIKGQTYYVVLSVVLGGLMIFIFYLAHFFSIF